MLKMSESQPIKVREVITPGVAELLCTDRDYSEFYSALSRFCSHDWGNLDNEDKKANEEALRYGWRTLGSYTISGKKIWIIQEWYSPTEILRTTLLPEEY